LIGQRYWGRPGSDSVTRTQTTTLHGTRRRGEPQLVSPSEVLGLDEELPQTVEALREEAILVCEQLVRDFPQRPEAHSVMALTNMRFGQTAEAVKIWEECLQRAPEFSPAYLGLGTVAALKEDFDNAVSYLRTALELNPELAGAYSQLTEVLLQQGKADEALAVAREHVRRFPASRESHYWLGQTHLELERYEDAKRNHEAAVKIDSELSSCYYSLAIACMRLGERDQAIAYHQKFAMLKEKDLREERGRDRQYRDFPAQQEVVANVYMSAGDVCLNVGDPRKAEAHWLRGAEVAPANTACREALVSLYERQERMDAALRLLAELVSLRPEHVAYRTRAGGFYARLGEAESAEAAFRQAIEQDSEAAEAYLGLVALHLESGWDVPDAVVLAERAVALAPSAQAYLQLSAARQEIGDRSGSVTAVEKAIQLDPGNTQLRELLEQLRRN